jgi:hypothetical protein
MKLDQILTDQLFEIEGDDTHRKKAETYYKLIDKICEVDALFRPVLIRIKKGLRDLIKEQDQELEFLKPVIKNLELEVKEKTIDNKTL